MSSQANHSEALPKRVRQARRPNVGAGQRASAIAEVARRLFLQHGYEGVSLEKIITVSGGSYREVYSTFGGKEQLFATVSRRMCTEILKPMNDALRSNDLDTLPLPVALTRIGSSILKTILAPDAIAFHRLMVSEAPRIPEVAQAFFRTGPRRANRILGAFFLRRSCSGSLNLNDPEASAGIFLDSLVGNLQLKLLTGQRVSPADVKLRVQHVVDVFLHGIERCPVSRD